MTMIIVAGTVRIDTSNQEAAQDVMREMIEKSRTEDGCIDYSYAVDVLDTTLIRVYEIWRDKAAMEAHFKTPHLKVWRDSWSSFGISNRQLSLFEVASMAPL